jgi:hypothetical protein
MATEEKFPHSWKLHRLFRKVTLLSLLGIALLPLLGILAVKTNQPSFLFDIGDGLFFICMIMFVLGALCMQFWPCPRCRKPFVFKMGRFDFRDKCAHCGLPFGAKGDLGPSSASFQERSQQQN